MIRVLIADDQALVRGGFRALLDARDDIEVAGEAATGAEAVDLARSLRPDVVLMDVRMPGRDGLEATRQIAADPGLAGVRVIILTTFELDEYLFDALRYGASGFLCSAGGARLRDRPGPAGLAGWPDMNVTPAGQARPGSRGPSVGTSWCSGMIDPSTFTMLNVPPKAVTPLPEVPSKASPK
jgi:CheY-like chemotaxis protein